MTYDAKTGMVIYRPRMHKGLKRNFQLMPGAQWLEMLCRHIPDRFEHLVRYVGWYSTRCRGERARQDGVGGQFMTDPPFTEIVWPVMKSASAERRNTIVPTRSCGSSRRRMARVAWIMASRSGRSLSSFAWGI